MGREGGEKSKEALSRSSPDWADLSGPLAAPHMGFNLRDKGSVRSREGQPFNGDLNACSCPLW